MKNILLIVIIAASLHSCKSSRVQEEPARTDLTANADGNGAALYLDFKRGPSHNHPSFVLWAEDMNGIFIQTLFISKAVGTSVYEHGNSATGKWEPGEIRRPASLPFWSHRRGIKASDGLYVPSTENPVADAFTGATPQGDFGISTKFDKDPPAKLRIYFEINQTWDWNEYWTNNKYPDDNEYKTSCQPALVYMCEIDLQNPGEEYSMKAIGHSHYSGKNGELFTDLSTLTTSLDIVNSLTVKFI